MKTALRIALVGLLCTLVLAESKQTLPKVITDSDGLGILVLPNGSKFKTTVYKLEIIGQLTTTSKLPYYILSGHVCLDCDAPNPSIFIHSPSDGPMIGIHFNYPGRVNDYKDGHTSRKTRTFFGDCIAGHTNAAVWFDRVVNIYGRWESSVTVADVKADRLVIEDLKQVLPAVSEAEDSVRSGQCHEIPGKDQMSLDGEEEG